MVKQIIRDGFFLRQKSEEATEKDREIITDLRDTLTANEDRQIGGPCTFKNLLLNALATKHFCTDTWHLVYY